MIETIQRTAIIRQGRDARLASRIALVKRRPGSFVGAPDAAGKQWFIVKTNPQCELRAVESILRIGHYAYTPVYRKRVLDAKSKRRVSQVSPFIVGYAFVLLPTSNLEFGMVRDCDGVRGLLPLVEGIAPIPFSGREVEEMMREEAAYWLKQDLEFRGRRRNWLKGKGVVVGPTRPTITAGAFEGFLAAIVEMEGKNAAKVVTHAFGKLHHLTVPLDQLLEAA